MATDSFKVHLKTKDIYADLAEDVEKRFKSSKYEVDRPLPIGKNKNVVRFIKDELVV